MEPKFYESLTVRQGAIGTIINQDDLFSTVPENWEIVLTDIRSSSAAVAYGMHRTVNLIATGSIVCVLNIAHEHHIMIPFFFGGDGATFLIPGVLVEEVVETLLIYREQIENNFGLTLRVGHTSVAEVYAAGQKLKIAKYSNSPKFTIPVIIGNGLTYAEQQIKGTDTLPFIKNSGRFEVNLSGLQCRWDQISPPCDDNEVVTLLVSAVQMNDQGSAFSKVLTELDNIYGIPQKRQPISETKLRINSTISDVGQAMLVRVGTQKWYTVLKEWLSVVYGYVYFRTRSGKTYLTTLVEMSDTLVLDGRINTVITGNGKQRERLLAALADMENSGEILYGIHVSQASVMSCYVPDQKDGHIHFVDGSGGGYTQASRMLKEKVNH
ncbi:MAG: DUF3095 family protein [Mucilaginibacter sp.]|uniref:DUF3095 family protein n=1 Tax=Mucilaginibacter sp. TaxID=1882438 RepID=UPI00326679F7